MFSSQRLFGSSENALMRTSLQYQGFTKVGIVLQLQGPYISLISLTLAVRRLQCRHPFLRSRLRNNPAKSNSYLMEEDSTLELKIREIPRKRDVHLHYWRQEWREREKNTALIGEGLAEFWLLQDPDDNTVEHAPRELIVICEHSICDGLSLSTVAHELLLALCDDEQNLFDNALQWSITMEAAIQRTISIWSKFITFSKFFLAAMYWRMTNTRGIARIPLAQVDFPFTEMTEYCHTEISYGTLSKQETQKLIEKCHQQRVTVTSAISSAILCVTSTLVGGVLNNDTTQLVFAMAADTRRRCIPPIPNHDLSYHVSGILAFTIPTRETTSATPLRMWQLANSVCDHLKKSIDAGQIFALGMIMGKLYEKNMGPPNLTDTPTFGISNWGILPFREQYGRWKLTATVPFVNMIRALMPFALIQTVNDTLTIVFIASAPMFPDHTLEKLRDGTLSNLRQMIDN